MQVCFRVGAEESEGKWMGSDGVGDGKGKRGGHTMTSPPSYVATSWSGVASPRQWRWCKVVGAEGGEGGGASGCWRANSSTTALWTSGSGSHMLSKFDQR